MEERTVNRPFGVRDEIGYGIGDTAGSFVNLYIEGYFLTFCTYVLGIAPQWMAGLFFGARLLDACLGPLLGRFLTAGNWESLGTNFYLGCGCFRFRWLFQEFSVSWKCLFRKGRFICG